MWGLGNEDDWPNEPNGNDHDAIRRYMTDLNTLAHHVDPSRVTCYRRCDFAADIPDVYSPSIWAGWYSGAYTEYRSALEKARPKYKHLFHAEWGADSHAGRHAEDADPALARITTGGSTAEKGFDYKLNGGALRMAKDGEWSETYACDLFDWYLKTLEELPWLTGAAQWVFKDFTTPLRVDNPVPRVNQKGVVTRDLQPKEGYYVIQSYWSETPMLRIYGHDWPVRWGHTGQQRMVRVYSNCAEVELFLNGKSLGRRRRNANDFPCAGLRWQVAFTEGVNDLKAIGFHDHDTLQDTVHFRYETRAWGAPISLSLSKLKRVGTQSTIQAELLDKQGVRCLDSRKVIRFSIAGDGVMMDNLGTPFGSRTVQLCNGRAELTVRHSSTIAVGATVDNISAVEQFSADHA
jgi:beta-galactosidase